MKLKKCIASTLVGVMTASTLVGCGSGSDSAKSEGDYDQVTYAYVTFNNIPSEEDLDTVEEEINKITREKIGAEITLMPIGIAEYSQKVSLALQGGEKIDLFESLGDFSNCVASDMAYDISDLATEYAPESVELIGQDYLDACRINGSLYGMPTYKPFALTPMIIYRSDIAEELGIDMSQVNNLDDVTAVLEQVEAAYPDMTPLAPTQTGDSGLSRMTPKLDYLGDGFESFAGVMLNDDMKVTDFYASDQFKSLCETARYWYQNDLIMKDAATTTSAAAELMASGNYFAYIASYSYPEESTANQLSAQTGGMPVGARTLQESYVSTSDISGLTWMVASTTDVPEAAMKFLNLTYTDKDIINLIVWGIEGRDYVLTDDNMAVYPDGEDSTTVPYTAGLSCGVVGNFFEMYGSTEDDLAWEQEQNENCAKSAAMGFVYDNSKVTTQYTAVNNVLSQYVPGLFCGSLDPDTAIPEFLKALEDAGYYEILQDKQDQLDAWVAENK